MAVAVLHVAHLVVHHLLAVAHLHLGHGQGADGLGQQLQALHTQGQLAGLGAHHGAVQPQVVPQVHQPEDREGGLAHHVLAHVDLQARGAVLHVREGGLAHLPPRHHAPRGGDGRLGLDQRIAVGEELRGGVSGGEAVGVRVHAQCAQALQLFQANGSCVVVVFHGLR